MIAYYAQLVSELADPGLLFRRWHCEKCSRLGFFPRTLSDNPNSIQAKAENYHSETNPECSGKVKVS